MSKDHEYRNVIAVTFEEDSKAYQALNVLRQADADGRVSIRSAVIVERQTDGTISPQEGEDNVIGLGTAGGSLIGMLVGVLGGPVGVLLGLGTGMTVGAAVDLDREDETEGALDQMSKSIPAGKTAVVAELDESAVEVVDGEMAALGGTVTRRSAEEVLAEMEAAEEAARASEKEARRVMREAKKAKRAEKHEQSKEKWDERVAALKDKMSHHDKTADTGS